MDTKIKRKIKRSNPKGWGGARKGAGRPEKPDREGWIQITCLLPQETVAKLRAGAGSRFYGEFLQEHLERYPLPTREEYLRGSSGPVRSEEVQRDREEVIRRRMEREAARFAKLSPGQQKLHREIAKGITKLFKTRAKRDHTGKVVQS